MADLRVEIEKLLKEVTDRRNEAEALSTGAAETMVRVGAGIQALDEVDPDQIRATADQFAGSVERLRELKWFTGRLMQLLY